jgi:hypothetical protein
VGFLLYGAGYFYVAYQCCVFSLALRQNYPQEFVIGLYCDVCVLLQVDCDDHKPLCSKFGVTGFPTIKWFPKGSLEPKEYVTNFCIEGLFLVMSLVQHLGYYIW